MKGQVKCVQWTGTAGPSSVCVASRDASLSGFKIDDEVEVLRVDPSRPDFEPGDRVRGKETGREGRVKAVAHDGNAWIVFWYPDKGGLTWEWPENLTKLPKEKTVVLRVTGPEDEVEAVVLRTTENQYTRGVRIERVEDE